MWSREPKGADDSQPGICESVCWLEGYERVTDEVAQMHRETRWVYATDRELDIIKLMQRAHALGNPADWLIRSKSNRKLTKDDAKLLEQVEHEAVLGEIEFYLPPRPWHQGCHVTQQLRCQRIQLTDGRKGTFEVTAILAREIEPPQGEKPVEKVTK